MNYNLYSFFYSTLALSLFFLYSGCRKDPYPGYDVVIDATGVWSKVGTFSGNINDMAVCNGKLWIGGDFTTTPSGSATRGSAYYDGTDFFAINHTYLYANSLFNKFMVSGDTLYAVGSLSSSKGNFLYWNSSFWQTVKPMSNTAAALAEYNNQFAVFDYYSSSYYYLRVWNGSSWNTSQPNGYVNDMEVYNNELYATGTFYYIDSYYNYYLSSYNNLGWNNVGANYQYNQPGNDLIVYNNELYICGNFSSMGGITQTVGIAKWNGTFWSSVGGGLTNGGAINKMYASNGSLYICGSFSEIGGVMVNNAAKWNGSSWSSIGKIFSGYPPTCIVEYNGSLYAAASGSVYKYTF